MRKGIPVALACTFIFTAASRAQSPLPDSCPSEQFIPASSHWADGGTEPCGPRFWLGGDYLLWWVHKAPQPTPLITTGPFNPDTFVPGVTPTPAALGSPGTAILYGGHDLGLGTFSGLRLQGGVDLSGDGSLAVEGGGFVLEQRSRVFAASSNAAGVPFLAIPVTDAATGQATSVATSFADDSANVFGGLRGTALAVTTTRLWGAEANVSSIILHQNALRVTALAGYRFLSLRESLDVDENFAPFGQPLDPGFLGGPIALGQSAAALNRFATGNQFYGGQVGARWEYLGDLVSAGLTTKVALGGTSQRIDVIGSSTLFAPGQAPVTAPGGVLALPSNSGRRNSSAFSVVPELGFNLGFRLTPCVRATVGYTLLYWTDVVRPGPQIDPVVDRTTVPTLQQFVPGATGTRPAPLRVESDFWAQGVNFGLELRF
jgi:hypothetical protein